MLISGDDDLSIMSMTKISNVRADAHANIRQHMAILLFIYLFLLLRRVL